MINCVAAAPLPPLSKPVPPLPCEEESASSKLLSQSSFDNDGISTPFRREAGAPPPLPFVFAAPDNSMDDTVEAVAIDLGPPLEVKPPPPAGLLKPIPAEEGDDTDRACRADLDMINFGYLGLCSLLRRRPFPPVFDRPNIPDFYALRSVRSKKWKAKRNIDG